MKICLIEVALEGLSKNDGSRCELYIFIINNSAHLFRPVESHLEDALSGADVPLRVHVYDPYCPVHGSRRRLRHGVGKTAAGQRLVDIHTIFASVETGEGDEDEHNQISQYLQR